MKSFDFNCSSVPTCIKCILVVWLCFSLRTVGLSQDLQFQYIGLKDGLSQINVWDIHQDRFGFIWIATEDGLNMYDGYTFTIFRKNALIPSSLSNSNVRCLVEDADGNLWIGTQSGLNFYDRNNTRFTTYRFDIGDPTSLSNNDIESLLIDSKGTLWVGTRHGLNVFNPNTNTFTRYYHNQDDTVSLSGNGVFAIYEDTDNRLWIGTGGGLSLLNTDGKTFTNFNHKSDDPSSLSSNSITALIQDSEGFLWVGTIDGGLNKKAKTRNTFSRYMHNSDDPKSINNNYIYCLKTDISGSLWIGTDNGVSKFNKTENSFERSTYDPERKNTLNSNIVTDLLFDNNNRMWVATRFGGINIYDKRNYTFVHYEYNKIKGKGLSHNFVTACKEDKHGNIWIGTDGGSLNYFDRKTKTFTNYINTFANNKVLAVEQDSIGNLWIGMWNGGLTYFNPKTGKLKEYRNDPANPKSLSDNNIFYILRDKKNNIWIATWGNGLNKYNPETDDFTTYTHNPDDINSITNTPIAYLMEDSNGNIWIATEGNGLDVLDPNTNTFVHHTEGAGHEHLSDKSVYAICEDFRNRIWIGTNGGGLNLYDPQTKTFTNFRTRDGLPDDVITQIVEDKNHMLWISTNKGLSRLNPETLSFKNFTDADGLQSNQFSRWSSAKLSTGEILFGGINGLNLFHPDSIKENTTKPLLYITDFRIFNEPVRIGENEILKKNIIHTDEIRLSYKENIFSFQFAALNFHQQNENRYRYMMEGFQKKWIDAGEDRWASFTNLNPGKYVFHVIGSNNDGVWNEEGKSITIIITPPFWATWWFRLICLFLFALSIYGLFRLRMRRIRIQKIQLEKQVRQSTAEVVKQKEALQLQAENLQAFNEEQQAQTEFLQKLNEELNTQKIEIIKKREEAESARKEAERANQAKSIFLATMSHEIRTPMNGVLGMASLLGETSLTAEQQQYADTIQSSGEALLTVINDILDFSKIESGNLELDNHNFDLRQCVEDVMDLFSAKSIKSNLDLIYEIDYRIPAQLVGDSHRLRQILINLISNAMKFTHHGEIFLGITLLKSEGNALELGFLVRDTGIGIPLDKLPHLFKAFSQGDSSTTRKYGGTGLGLIISQRLVELMGGTINVESDVGVGTTFTFTIQTLVSQEIIRQYVNSNLTGIQGKSILIVDDNLTNLTILENQLKYWKLYVTSAVSGEQALEILSTQSRFDAIITDMQMPDMDGIQLAQRIRRNYPGLPVILLSSIGDENKRKHRDLFYDVLNKPAKQQQLSAVIQSALKLAMPPSESVEKKHGQMLTPDFAKKYPLRILLADDNVVNQKLTVRVLNKLGYDNVEVAQNGIEVLEKFEHTFFDIILMDMQMPEMDGLEATRKIRVQQRRQPFIISMTANVMQSDRDACIQAGMNDYISKPIKLEYLIRTLETAALSLRNASN